ncbi:hypothetical protein C6341_g25752 [Phytophthora cactorum]|nr:hypothetical protein C6341_g25752 [Phytophthora cactorum]
MNNKVLIPRRVIKLEMKMAGFPVYQTEAFVWVVPEKNHLILDMPWPKELIPEVAWTNRSIKYRGAQEPTVSHDDMLMNYTKHTLTSSSGTTQVITTQVITTQNLKKHKHGDGEFCFFVNIASEKAGR